MTDREKIVNGLLEVKDNINCPSGGKKARLMDIVDKAIALLIEQESMIKDLEEEASNWEFSAKA